MLSFNHMHYTLSETNDADEFVTKAVDWLVMHINAAIADHDSCSIGLSGGSTPKPIYTKLGQRKDIDWSKVSIFLLDERYVPNEHPDSNQKMVVETLLVNAPIPPENVFFPDTNLTIEECVADYIADVKTLWEKRLPDITVLGMGDDGHIASLFPPLDKEELSDTHFALHTQTPLKEDRSPRFPILDRISLTLNPIVSAQSHLVLLQGPVKRATWEAMLASNDGDAQWPMKRVLEQEEVMVLIG
jgi:6-phosphogluconolactonase